ncbi:MAG TPA: hypothetical protein VFS20_21020 [Longimicrobium sp.]|nr:hypothetical protein [Longimicrobium sp.]
MPDDRTRKWLRTVDRHAILESVALNALVTSLVFVVSSRYDEILDGLSGVNLHVEPSRQAIILALVMTVTLPSIFFVVRIVGRIARARLRIRYIVAREVRHTESELLGSVHARVASKVKSEEAA